PVGCTNRAPAGARSAGMTSIRADGRGECAGGDCPWQLSTRSDEGSFVGDDHELGTVTSTELGHRAANVGLGRGGGDDQRVRDLFVAAPRGNESHYLPFAVG